MSLADKISFKMMSFYHETLYSLFRDPYEVLRAAGVTEGQRVLEIGCGPGFFTVPAGEIVGTKGSVNAIDINSIAIQHVREKVSKGPVRNIEVSRVDAADTEFSDEKFDLVFVFGLARSKGSTLGEIWREAFRVLKADGILSVEGGINPPEDLFERTDRRGRIDKFVKA
ncbi:class I SAM-dependent methyltransferase [Candidatus Bipolaricaulota bacterium]|nr:class I SAM-dependent methyltransferase [Candidatus Bipolaricaulota bacterium]